MSKSDDIVTRLRSQGEGCTCNAWGGYECACGAEWGDNYVLEAADEIERLQEENTRLQAYINALQIDRQIAASEARRG